ncbi:hypothetical protein SEA_CIRCINUS_131 [Streptomyces phage Circinus]|uniref:RIIA-like protein n=1 Tax=Streptomyces phage Circinus TaxID=2562189 RepID=A0A4D6E174_9CAUD|nr:hypothetical protein SEA_CIRCINUS_131 [Streptomyces phage Circinus]
MRPNTIVAQREGNLGGNEHKMMFDENSVAHLMSVLTDLYSDPELAVIREYSTNALDSHIAAGTVRPIEVTTPNALSPFFKVKDYGLGMDEEDIKNIYSKYGASTKRDSDSVVGMLGLGCKSALTYTQQFTLNTVKNGVKYMVAVSRTEDGSGVMEVIDSSPTDELNSVEVVVPVKRGNEFERKSRDFFRFWKPGTVLLNGAQPQGIGGKEIAPGVFMVRDISSDYLVMGNVAYPLDIEHALSDSQSYYKRWAIVAYVEIGSVNFTPSRESLHYTRRTEATIREFKKIVDERITKVVQEDIDSKDNEWDAFQAYYEWSEFFGGNYGGSRYMPRNVVYKGTELPTVFRADGMLYNTSASRYAVSDVHKMDARNAAKTPVIYDYPSEKVAPTHREKMRAWRKDNASDAYHIFVCKELPEFPDWLPIQTVKWEDVKSIKIVREKTGATRSKPRFEIFYDGKDHYLTKDEIKKTEIVLVKPKNYMSNASKKQLEALRPGIGIVTLTESRWDAFKKTFPNAKSLEEILRELVVEVKDALTKEDLLFLSVRWYSRNVLIQLDPKRIDDPTLSNIVTFVKSSTASDNVKRYNTWHSIYNDITIGTILDRNATVDTDVMDNYPLIRNLQSDSLEDAYCYINAKYATMNK